MARKMLVSPVVGLAVVIIYAQTHVSRVVAVLAKFASHVSL